MEVNIRPLAESDAYTSVVWRNIPEIWKLTGSRPDKRITIEDELTWINKVIKEEDSKRFAILADDKYVGNIYLTDIDAGCGELHIFIGEKSYWGKGVAGQASRLIIDYARDHLKLTTITLAVNEGNVASGLLCRKLGFKKTGSEDDFEKMKLELGNYGGKIA